MDVGGVDVLSLIHPELLILIPVCWGIGLLLKSTKIIKNKYIPLILAICSVSLTTLYTFAENEITNIPMGIFLSITQGIVCWAIAWVSYEKGIKCKNSDK